MTAKATRCSSSSRWREFRVASGAPRGNRTYREPDSRRLPTPGRLLDPIQGPAEIATELKPSCAGSPGRGLVAGLPMIRALSARGDIRAFVRRPTLITVASPYSGQAIVLAYFAVLAACRDIRSNGYSPNRGPCLPDRKSPAPFCREQPLQGSRVPSISACRYRSDDCSSGTLRALPPDTALMA